MTSFALLVTGSPTTTQAPWTALEFAKGVLTTQNQLQGIFFYSEAVHLARLEKVIGRDEVCICTMWQEFLQAHQMKGLICVSAALRRGILDQQEAVRYQQQATLNPGFHLVGLGEWAEISKLADQVVQFR